MSTPTPQRDYSYTQADFKRVCALIRQRAGISLAAGKADMVYSRLVRRLRALHLTSFVDYLDRLEREGGEEWEHFTNALTTNLTAFFREPHHFDILKTHFASSGPYQPMRIWCAAASTGEEPYSIAMAACEHYGSMNPPVTILATDIDTKCLETAEAGIYPIERVEKLSPERKRRFFRRGSGDNEGLCRVDEALRQMITFRPLNLLDRSYGLKGPFDAVFCRNVMIYFDKPTQYDILTRIVPLMGPKALFFAGHSESFFHAVDLIAPIGRTVYQHARRPGASAVPGRPVKEVQCPAP